MADEKKDIKENQENKNKPGGLPKFPEGKNKFNFYWVYGIIAVIFIALTFTNLGGTCKEVDWGELRMMLKDGDVEKIVIVNREEAEIFLSKEALNDSKYEDVKRSGIRWFRTTL